MRTSLRAIPVLVVLVLLSSVSVIGQTTADEFYRQWVDYRDGEISVHFDQTLHAIHARTGLQIVIPSPGQARVLNLRLHRQPLEPAMRSLISIIGYKTFALLYDENGRPARAVVLGVQPAPGKTVDEAAERDLSEQSFSAQEQEKLQRDLSRWRELKPEERTVIEERLKALPPSEQREKFVSEYGRQVLGLNR
jgi:hypothetical protein